MFKHHYVGLMAFYSWPCIQLVFYYEQSLLLYILLIKLPCIIEIKWLYRSVNHDSCMKYIIYIVHLSIDLCSCFCKLRQPDILLNETVLLWFCFCSWSCDRVFKIHFKMSQNYTLIQSKTQIFNKTKSLGKTSVVLCTLLPYCQTRV